MSMDQYEHRKENLWKEAYSNDPAFPFGESPVAKVISFFCKRKANDVEIDINKITPEKEVNYDIMVNVDWVNFHLKRTLRYKKNWKGDKELYKFIVLCNYVDQCNSGNYSKCVLSAEEFMTLKPKKK